MVCVLVVGVLNSRQPRRAQVADVSYLLTHGSVNRSIGDLAMFVCDPTRRYISSRKPNYALMTLCQRIDGDPGFEENNPFESKRSLIRESMRARMTLRKGVNGRAGCYCATALLVPHYTSGGTLPACLAHETYQ
jgi:hypothetical protein